MANLCIKTPSSAILVLIFQLLVLRPRPIGHSKTGSWHLGFHLLILLFDWKTALGYCWKGVAETKIIITLLSYFNGYINCLASQVDLIQSKRK